jgi:hypothetical protein
VHVYFRTCAESCDETVDLFFECAVGGVRADELVEASDALARHGCECVAVRGVENGCF